MLIFGLGNVHVLCIHASRTPSIHHRRETLDLSVFGDLDIPQSACNGTIHGTFPWGLNYLIVPGTPLPVDSSGMTGTFLCWTI